MATGDFRDLIVWQRSQELLREVYRLNRQLPPEERYEMGSQLRRAAGSVSSNIAEGHSSAYRKVFLAQLSSAHASLKEVDNHLISAVTVGHLYPEDVADALALSDEVSRMLRVMRRKLGG
ncbi:CHP02436-containing protein [Gemmatirosa kalamazoonensis]|uniref:CHP02436-containing protein n=1 Tax=Gemmatirosa kalamazoonensis TaxID=861299 RepID=W0RF96_9BACT|nr:four helix bundle protein [Gemmatirosa kalamazoonensis]AHG88058.1 CHP02436-containing protein [Gemmatirosa kalamazoonensis]